MPTVTCAASPKRATPHAFRAITRTAPDELTLWAHLVQFPPIPDVPEPIRVKSFVSVDVTYLGSADDAEQLLMPLRAIPAQFMDGLGTVPLAALGSICMEPVDPMPTMDMAGMLRDFDDAAIDALLAVAGAGSGSPLTVVQIRHFGGALARGTACDGPAGAVEEPYQLFCLGVPVAPPVAAAVEITFAAIRNALRDQLTDRTFFTFLGADDDSSQAFGPGALERLRDIKRSVDPHGVVRSNRPVIR
jgi:hypothetical protein